MIGWLTSVIMALAALLIGLFIGRHLRPPPPPVPAASPLPPQPRDIIGIETLTDPALIVEGFTAVAANADARLLFGERATLELRAVSPALVIAEAVVPLNLTRA